MQENFTSCSHGTSISLKRLKLFHPSAMVLSDDWCRSRPCPCSSPVSISTFRLQQLFSSEFFRFVHACVTVLQCQSETELLFFCRVIGPVSSSHSLLFNLGESRSTFPGCRRSTITKRALLFLPQEVTSGRLKAPRAVRIAAPYVYQDF